MFSSSHKPTKEFVESLGWTLFETNCPRCNSKMEIRFGSYFVFECPRCIEIYFDESAYGLKFGTIEIYIHDSVHTRYVIDNPGTSDDSEFYYFTFSDNNRSDRFKMDKFSIKEILNKIELLEQLS